MELESSIVARAFNEYKWILNFSDSFPVLGPEAMSVSLSFLEENVGLTQCLEQTPAERVFHSSPKRPVDTSAAEPWRSRPQ